MNRSNEYAEWFAAFWEEIWNAPRRERLRMFRSGSRRMDSEIYGNSKASDRCTGQNIAKASIRDIALLIYYTRICERDLAEQHEQQQNEIQALSELRRIQAAARKSILYFRKR